MYALLIHLASPKLFNNRSVDRWDAIETLFIYSLVYIWVFFIELFFLFHFEDFQSFSLLIVSFLLTYTYCYCIIPELYIRTAGRKYLLLFSFQKTTWKRTISRYIYIKETDFLQPFYCYITFSFIFVAVMYICTAQLTRPNNVETLHQHSSSKYIQTRWRRVERKSITKLPPLCPAFVGAFRNRAKMCRHTQVKEREKKSRSRAMRDSRNRRSF